MQQFLLYTHINVIKQIYYVLAFVDTTEALWQLALFVEH